MTEKNSKVKDGKFITVASFMIKELNLKGNDLLVYAIIYGFSQTDGMKGFSGSLQYLADWTNSTKRGIIKNLESLIQRGYIAKEVMVINGVKYCTYTTVDLEQLSNEHSSIVVNSVHGGSEHSSMGVVNKVHGGSELSSHNNIEYNIDNNIEDNTKPVEATPQTPLVEKNQNQEVDGKSSKSKKESIFEDFAKDNLQLLQALKDFEESRSKNRSKMTERAKRLLLTELQKFNPNDWVAILNQSVLNGWKSVYPLKNESQKQVASSYQPRYDEWNWGNN